MAPSADTLSLAEARRIGLAAQGFADPRPAGRIDRRHLRRVLRRVGLVQIDSVNVLTRSHELPFLARLGPYPRQVLTSWLWGSGEVVEHWGHEASLLPVELLPLLRWRMRQPHPWANVRRAHLDQVLVARVLDLVRARGPVSASDLDELGAATARRKVAGGMWDWSDAKKALEALFSHGEVLATRRPTTFERVYDVPERIIGEPWLDDGPPQEEACRQLLRYAAERHGVGTARCLADYLRLNIPQSRAVLESLADEGELRRVEVEGWRHPAYLHPEAALPRRVRAAALLSPFDSLVWERTRLEQLFGFHYRLEIYVPAAKRVHGYYVLPYLQDETLTARVDLKADRQAGVLQVRGAYDDGGTDPHRLGAALREMATFLGLDDIAVADRGDLAPALRTAVAR